VQTVPTSAAGNGKPEVAVTEPHLADDPPVDFGHQEVLGLIVCFVAVFGQHFGVAVGLFGETLADDVAHHVQVAAAEGTVAYAPV